MENLWSPWRSKYISSFKNSKDDNNSTCFICNAANCTDFNEDNLVVGKTDKIVIFMNRYPYNSGHLLLAPKLHIGDFAKIDVDTLTDINLNIQIFIKILDKLYKPHGYNIGANLGRSAGAGVPEHIHYHIVPRWNGDSNFISVIGDTKVISDSIEEARINIANEYAKIIN